MCIISSAWKFLLSPAPRLGPPDGQYLIQFPKMVMNYQVLKCTRERDDANCRLALMNESPLIIVANT